MPITAIGKITSQVRVARTCTEATRGRGGGTYFLPRDDRGSTMTKAMRAVVLDGPGGPDMLTIRDVPRPTVEPGHVLIQVRAFGLNRSELHFRQGLGSFGSFPRIPGIEATGVVAQAPGGEFRPGAQVAALMGGMGRTIDGGYAEYVAVPASSVVPFTSNWTGRYSVPYPRCSRRPTVP